MDKVVVQQDRAYRVGFMAQNEGEKDLQEVVHIHELSPYTMLLASLGVCTTILLHSYAQHHGVDLELAEITLTYHRRDVHGASQGGRFEEWIEESLHMQGNLSEEEYQRMGQIGTQCSIHKMLESGIEVRSELAPQAS